MSLAKLIWMKISWVLKLIDIICIKFGACNTNVMVFVKYLIKLPQLLVINIFVLYRALDLKNKLLFLSQEHPVIWYKDCDDVTYKVT